MDHDILEGDVLHIHVGDRCSNRCIFCNEDTASRRARVGGTTAADVDAVMARFPLVPEVLFTCGEPTLHPDLPAFIALAKARAVPRIALITNGRRLADDAFLRLLVERGLNAIAISVHGHRAEIHDALVRRKGAFAEVAQGLGNVARLRREGARLHTTLNAVITQTNRAYLPAIHAWFGTFEPDEVIFNAVSPRSRGERHYDLLMDSYADIMAALAPLNRPFLHPPLRVLEIPACVMVHSGFLHSGGRESWLVYEKEVPFIETTAAMNPFFIKPPTCEGCLFYTSCEGIYQAYAKRFGTEEFRPVTMADRFPRPLRELFAPLLPENLDPATTGGFCLTDYSLRRMRKALLLTFTHPDDEEPVRLAIKPQPGGLQILPVTGAKGELDLPAFKRRHRALLLRLRDVLSANAAALQP